MFLLSKTFWFLFQPVNIMFALFVVAAILLYTKYTVLGRRLVVIGLCFGLTIAHSPIAQLMLQPLEDRFPRPPLPQNVTGIISLGGGLDLDVSANRGIVEIESAADRITELVLLGRRYPNAKLIYTGGTSNVFYGGPANGDLIRDYLTAFGIEPGRLIIEYKSRNTFENATLTYEMVTPKPDETYILVTSAFHMPRSMGVFRKNGWSVIPWPVDYRTTGKSEANRFFYSAILFMENASLAVKEWFGLLAYWMQGRTAEFFPAP
jgi:uncharacterized SAM-binding protein YcdF (DUF218 family)